MADLFICLCFLVSITYIVMNVFVLHTRKMLTGLHPLQSSASGWYEGVVNFYSPVLA